MSDQPVVYTGRLVELDKGPDGRMGRVSVRGARTSVFLDLLPEARLGDTVLVHAGVALALVKDAHDRVECEGREG
jgi:hydrogenase maturation factor